MCCGAAALRIPLTTLGLLQSVAPLMQFLIGVLIYDEAMPASRLAGFALVWVALMVFTWDALRAAQIRGRASRLVAPTEAGEPEPVAGRAV